MFKPIQFAADDAGFEADASAGPVPASSLPVAGHSRTTHDWSATTFTLHDCPAPWLIVMSSHARRTW